MNILIIDLPIEISVIFDGYLDNVSCILFRLSCKDISYVLPKKQHNIKNIEDLWSFLATTNYLSLMKWLIQKHKINNCVTKCAAKNGNLEVLQWARQNGCKWGPNTCVYAAENGHLEVLQWARQNGCEWNSDTCAYAALNGHLEVLQWARQNGCKRSLHAQAL